MKKIINKVHGTQLISWADLKKFEFNDLKDKDRDISKLKNSIVNDGFSFPLYIWKDHKYVIDGNGRNIALTELEAEGYKLPELPIVGIEANTKAHAKKLVLQASSQYGKITKESFDLFIEDIDLDLEDIEIKIDVLDFSGPEDFSEIDFDNIESNADREKKFKTQNVTCPECEYGFEVQI